MELKLEARNICKEFIDNDDRALPVLSNIALQIKPD